MFSRIRPGLCWIGLFSLNFGHLPKRMLFARRRKQGHREENSEDAPANEESHSALAQLSVSRRKRKIKARLVGREGGAVVARSRCEHEQRPEAEEEL